MFKREKSNRSIIFKSKYVSMDIENMSDEEFSKISKKVYTSIILRGVGGIILLILSLIAMVLGGKYAW